MTDSHDGGESVDGEELLRVLSALSSAHRLQILSALSGGAVHVSGLARAVGLGRPLVHMHLKRLEAAGLVSSRLELSDDGKAMRFYEMAPFAIQLTPDVVVEASRTLEPRESSPTPDPKETP